jgi:hypothetical protein
LLDFLHISATALSEKAWAFGLPGWDSAGKDIDTTQIRPQQVRYQC